MKHYFGLFFSILISFCAFNENSATVLSARCKSRCLAKEILRYRNVTSVPYCTTKDCSACMKPCQEEKKASLSCYILCGSNAHVKKRNICKDSCKFMKHLHLEDHGNSSCPTGVAESKCKLMRPENVHISTPTTKKESTKVIWNGTWPPETVFVVFERWQKKGLSQDWREFKQTTLQLVTVELQPLVWHQFKVLAANQYTTSLFSIPSKLEFAELRRPGPPREFRVLSMRTVKGHAEVDISWRKPESINGLPIHKYKLSWSMRPDVLLAQYENFEVSEERIKGNMHRYTINELQSNTTYVLEIQAILRLNTKRVRSSRVTLTVRTPPLAKDEMKKTVLKKTSKGAKNSISSSTKSTNGKMAVVSNPTIQGPNSKSIHVSTPPSQVSTPQRNGTESLNLKVQKSVAVLINVLGLHTDISIASVVIMICYL